MFQPNLLLNEKIDFLIDAIKNPKTILLNNRSSIYQVAVNLIPKILLKHRWDHDDNPLKTNPSFIIGKIICIEWYKAFALSLKRN